MSDDSKKCICIEYPFRCITCNTRFRSIVWNMGCYAHGGPGLNCTVRCTACGRKN